MHSYSIYHLLKCVYEIFLLKSKQNGKKTSPQLVAIFSRWSRKEGVGFWGSLEIYGNVHVRFEPMISHFFE